MDELTLVIGLFVIAGLVLCGCAVVVYAIALFVGLPPWLAATVGLIVSVYLSYRAYQVVYVA